MASRFYYKEKRSGSRDFHYYLCRRLGGGMEITMTQEPMTLYKLIILYMLDCASFPLTLVQIDNFILEREYTNYLTLQQAIGELSEIHLISVQSSYNRTQFMLTNEGRSTLDFFRNQIPAAIRQDIKTYLKENSLRLQNEVAIAGAYQKTKDGSYQTVLSAKDHGELLVELKLTVPDEKTASGICRQWQKRNEEIYGMLVKELFS